VSQLTVRDVKASDFGQYKCLVFVGDEQNDTARFSLVERKTAASLSIQPASRLVLLPAASLIEFSCSLNNASHLIQLGLYRDNVS
jgi:hypothetical protein